MYLIDLAPLTGLLLHEARVDTRHYLVKLLASEIVMDVRSGEHLRRIGSQIEGSVW